ncbi:hypothetical protein B0H16DRAFT_1828098 [Mycena metata]|uniref:Glucose-6-phosphate 1-dehydrogenase n=1 Tax=Mycena metata TaxID=1033252 RepID=A0AAD7M7Q9_9AGAR|nr:hypothetical protein B0H16DRAFT_1828098 [Mycena metata]
MQVGIPPVPYTVTAVKTTGLYGHRPGRNRSRKEFPRGSYGQSIVSRELAENIAAKEKASMALSNFHSPRAAATASCAKVGETKDILRNCSCLQILMLRYPQNQKLRKIYFNGMFKYISNLDQLYLEGRNEGAPLLTVRPAERGERATAVSRRSSFNRRIIAPVFGRAWEPDRFSRNFPKTFTTPASSPPSPPSSSPSAIRVISSKSLGFINLDLRLRTLRTIGIICESITLISLGRKPEILTLWANEILTALIHGARKEGPSTEIQLVHKYGETHPSILAITQEAIHRSRWEAGLPRRRYGAAWVIVSDVCRDDALGRHSAIRGCAVILKTGKALNEAKIEVRIQFNGAEHLQGNHAKRARSYFSRQTDCPLNLIPSSDLTRFADTKIPEAYEAPILDTLQGDHSKFLRHDELHVAWKNGMRTKPLPSGYGSRGPSELNAFIERFGYQRTAAS